MSLCYEQLQNYCINQLYQKCKQQDSLIKEQNDKIAVLEERLKKLEDYLYAQKGNEQVQQEQAAQIQEQLQK